MVHPSVSDIFRNGVIPGFPYGFSGEVFFFLMANIGTTIAPWMLFFQQSSIVDKRLQEKDINMERVDTAVGSTFTVIVAVFCVIVTGTVLRGVNILDAGDAAQKLMGINRYVGTFMAIGLFDAGLVGSLCIAQASSWAYGEVFGWAHSLNTKLGQAPWFYGLRLFILLTAGIVVLIPHAPLVLITLFVQVIAVTLLPAGLTFLILLLNDEKTVGKYKNTLTQNILGFSIVGLIIVLSTMYAISALFPNLFH